MAWKWRTPHKYPDLWERILNLTHAEQFIFDDWEQCRLAYWTLRQRANRNGLGRSFKINTSGFVVFASREERGFKPFPKRIPHE
jgi:hypothetical protein